MALIVPNYVSATRDARHGGAAGYILHDASTGAHYAADAETYAVFRAIRDGEALDRIAARSALSETAFKALIGQFVRHGLAIQPGETPSTAAIKPPLESRLIFFRLDLIDIRPIVDRLIFVLRLPFSKLGVACWAVLMSAAAFSVIGEPQAIARAIAGFADLSWESAVVLLAAIVCLKIWHELGHATALRHFTALEGFDPGPIRAGIAVFAFLPFPYTDATAAWRIGDRFRRAAIGLAGIYFESWIAAVAALLWAWIRPGETQTVLIQILTIAGFSTLLFNLNPLVRLDGYFVLSDLLDLRNLAGRSSRAAQAAGLQFVAKSAPAVERPLLIYWTLAFVYRCLIFAGIFWLAYQVDPRLAWAPAVIGAMLLVGRPLSSMVKRARRAGVRKGRLAAVAAAAVLLTAVALVPIADTVHVDGVVVRYDQENVQVRENARLADYAEAARPETTALTLESPDLELRLAQLRLDLAQIEGTLRAEGSRDAERSRLLRSEATRLAAQLSETATRVAALTVRLDADAVWRPDGARAHVDGWVAAFANNRLGQVARPTPPHLRAYVDQARSDLGDHLAPGAAVAVRAVAFPACNTTARARAFAPVTAEARPMFRLDAGFATGDPCLDGLPEGAAVVIRIAREDASAVVQLYNHFRRLALNRLPIDMTRTR